MSGLYLCETGAITIFKGKIKRVYPTTIIYYPFRCLWEIRPPTVDNKNYFVTFIDDYTHFTVVYQLTHKLDVLNTFKDFVTKSEAKFNLKIANLYCDNEGISIRRIQRFSCRKGNIIPSNRKSYTTTKWFSWAYELYNHRNGSRFGDCNRFTAINILSRYQTKNNVELSKCLERNLTLAQHHDTASRDYSTPRRGSLVRQVDVSLACSRTPRRGARRRLVDRLSTT